MARSGESLKLLQIWALALLCRAAGLKGTKLGQPGTFGFVKTREYDPSDFWACEFLAVVGLKVPHLEVFGGRNGDTRATAHAPGTSRLADFTEANHRIVALPDARTSLEREHFVGLAFEAFQIGPERQPAGRELWALGTTITLPKLANTARLMCYGMGGAGKVEPFTGDYCRMLFIEDSPYASGEPHYRRIDLRSLGQFDAAQTFERLWIPRPSLVISQRLYRFFTSRNIPIIVQPVRIDET